MKKIFKLFLPIAALFVAVSCAPSEVVNEQEVEAKAKFMEVTAPSFTLEGNVLTQYNKQTDQIVFSEDKQESMVANLTFDKLYTVELSAAPELNASLMVNGSTVGLNDINFSDRKMTVIKVADNLVWLWDSSKLVGIVMQY